MAYYRFYLLGSDGHIKAAREGEYESDERAMAAARETGTGRGTSGLWQETAAYAAVEVWERTRKVGQIEPRMPCDLPGITPAA